MKNPTISDAVAAGIRDKSYDTVRYGWVPSYTGRAVVVLADGTTSEYWHARGYGPTGGPDWIGKYGGVQFDRISDPVKGSLLKGAYLNPKDVAAWAALTDYLEEKNDPDYASAFAEYSILRESAELSSAMESQSTRMATEFADAIRIIERHGQRVQLAQHTYTRVVIDDDVIWCTSNDGSDIPMVCELDRAGFRVVRLGCYMNDYSLSVTRR